MKTKCQNCLRLKLNSELVLFGNDGKTKTDEGFDYITLLAKHFVYMNKINKNQPRLGRFINELKTIYKTDYIMHCMEMRVDDFYKKWISYNTLKC